MSDDNAARSINASGNEIDEHSKHIKVKEWFI